MGDRAVATIPNGNGVRRIDETDDLRLLRETYGKDVSDAEFRLLVADAQHRGLSVVKREVVPIRFQGKMQPFVTIHGLRKIAEESGKYLGSEGPFFCAKDSEYVDTWRRDDPPWAAKFIVHRVDSPFPTIAIVYWKERAVPNSPTWKAMPSVMLGKVAESDAIKRARLVPDDIHISMEDDPYDAREAKRGAMRHIHGVARERGLDHDQVRTVVQAIRPGISSLTSDDVSSRDLLGAAELIAGTDDNQLREILGGADLSAPPRAATVEIEGRSVDTTTGEIIEVRPAVESQRQALRKLGLKLKISSNELTAFCGDLDELSYDRAAELIKHLSTHTSEDIRADLAQPDLIEPAGFPDGLADFDPYDHGTTDMFGDTAEADTARRRAKAEALTN